MISLPPEVWLSAGAVLASLIAGVFSYAVARRASRGQRAIEERKLDIAEANRYQDSTQRLIENLRAEVNRLDQRVEELHHDVQREKDQRMRVEEQLRVVTKRANDLHFEKQVLLNQIEGG